MEIVFVSNGMHFASDTVEKQSLGGSETACLMVAREMKKRGHIVTVFTPLPGEDRPDHHVSGQVGSDGVRYVDLDHYAGFVSNTEIDLLIAMRDPRFVATTSQAKKRVLWCHDVATHRGYATMFSDVQWTWDEIWCVSKWHAKQINEVTGYPLDNIVPFRNGIVPVDIDPPPFRSDRQLVFAARPERGLLNIIDKDGIAGLLPEYTFDIAMYANFPEHMRDFYAYIGQCVEQNPNVNQPRNYHQHGMRQLLSGCRAYVYPTQFEETSCILARECIEQRTPFLTTKKGALPETLKKCGVFFEDYLAKQGLKEPQPEGTEWRKLFAEFVRWALESEEGREVVRKSVEAMEKRKDLYWGGVAKQMLKHAEPKEGTVFSRAWSLIQDGDVIPAYRYLQHKQITEGLNWATESLLDEIETLYPFILDESDPRYQTLSDYYQMFYAEKANELQVNEMGLLSCSYSPRYSGIKQEIAKLPPGSTVYEYGAGEGHVIVNLANEFPAIQFVAFDQVHENIKRHGMYDGERPNLVSYHADTPEEAFSKVERREADAVLCVEVLEHCPDTFSVADGVESMVKKGGRVIITTPVGNWEVHTTHYKPGQWELRNHIWHYTKSMYREMFQGKPNSQMMYLAATLDGNDEWAIGNMFFAYDADHNPVKRIDPLDKAREARVRQTCSAAIIAYNNESTIKRTLDSLNLKVQAIRIAHGPSTDDTLAVIEKWKEEHPWCRVQVVNAPRIQAPKKYGGTADEGEEFGFDDARNLSIQGLDKTSEYMLWIDTDEYLVGHIGKYLRNNCLDGYLIPQHHFTVEPRGGPTQIDRPARLIKTDRGYQAKGHIHEHFEVPVGGPGVCCQLGDVDLGHMGYENETVRRARFSRNYPFLEWDHETGPDRNLHPFLWFRDIIHRMRYAEQEGRSDVAHELALEGENYYNEHQREMENYGAGVQMALQYLTEVRRVLGKGVEMKIAFAMEDRSAELASRFESAEEIAKLINRLVGPEIKTRTSRYF
jgi:2-polyprenyl-3-methyl-5-hydroxy-6-metoxy-1,4-benzoquinol methylase/glycosyltransferase involved in cell wall biosynthesis